MKASLSAIGIVYLSGFLQGVSLILYPAAGPIFTNPEFHNLSGGQYGLLFTPQIILAILSSFSVPVLARQWGMKRVLQAGLVANVLSMALFGASHFALGTGFLPFGLLLAGTAALGTGFGLTISAINPYAYSFFPGKEASAVTGLHILLGLGTAVSALILSYFSSIGVWWGAGLVIGIVFLLTWIWSVPISMPLKEAVPSTSTVKQKGIPGRLWLFFTIVFLYGACEATFGNFAPIYLEQQAGLSLASASLGLSLFWGAIAVGRLLFTLGALRFDLRVLHFSVPIVVAGVFVSIPFLQGTALNYTALIIAGLGLSFYFPYSISLGTDEFPHLSATVSGMLVAAIQLGTGVSSNIIGSLGEAIPLGSIIQFSGVYAILMAGIAWFLYASRKSNKIQLENV